MEGVSPIFNIKEIVEKMKVLRRINDFYTRVERIVIIMSSFSLWLLVLIAVVNRYFIKRGIAWYEELVMFFFMLLVYWGTSNVAKYNEHLSLTILQEKIKKKRNKIYLNLFINFICLTISVIGIYFSIKISSANTMKTLSLKFPKCVILYSTLVMGFFGLTLRYLYRFVDTLNKLKRKSQKESIK